MQGLDVLAVCRRPLFAGGGEALIRIALGRSVHLAAVRSPTRTPAPLSAHIASCTHVWPPHNVPVPLRLSLSLSQEGTRSFPVAKEINGKKESGEIGYSFG